MLKLHRRAADFICVSSRKPVLFLIIFALVVPATTLPLTGCGGHSAGKSVNQPIAEAHLTAIDAEITTAETTGSGSLPDLTGKYITEIQSSLDVIGAAEAKQKLADIQAKLAPYCTSCAQRVAAAAAQISQ